MKRSLPGSARIKHGRDFQRLKGASAKLHSRHFLLLVERTSKPGARIGITVSTKVDKRAVVRNKLRRRIREVFRLNRHKIHEPFDIVVIARKNAPSCSFDDIRREITGALFHAGFFK